MREFTQPSRVAPDEGFELAKTIQATVAGITALDGTMVRVRWTPTQVAMPLTSENWCAVGAISTTTNGSPIIAISEDQTNVPAPVLNTPGDDDPLAGGLFGNRSVTLQQNMRINFTTFADVQMVASFYGPDALTNAGLLRDGLSIESNRWALQDAGFDVHTIGQVLNLPEQVGTEWRTRADLHLTLNRVLERTYIIGSLPVPDITYRSN